MAQIQCKVLLLLFINQSKVHFPGKKKTLFHRVNQESRYLCLLTLSFSCDPLLLSVSIQKKRVEKAHPSLKNLGSEVTHILLLLIWNYWVTQPQPTAREAEKCSLPCVQKKDVNFWWMASCLCHRIDPAFLSISIRSIRTGVNCWSFPYISISLYGVWQLSNVQYLSDKWIAEAMVVGGNLKKRKYIKEGRKGYLTIKNIILLLLLFLPFVECLLYT